MKIADSRFKKDYWNEGIIFEGHGAKHRKMLKKELGKARRRINKRYVKRLTGSGE